MFDENQRKRMSTIVRLAAPILAIALLVGCDRQPTEPSATRSDEAPTERSTGEASADATTAAATTDGETTGDEASDDDDPYAEARREMVATQIEGRDVTDERVLDAMRAVPRHEFVLEKFEEYAYTDRPLPIGHDQTISQPYIVARMTQELQPNATDKVLEIGTGSGYQAAVLSRLVDHLYTIEIVCPLAEDARADLARAGYDDNVTVKCGDGYKGWPEEAPFDKIIVTAAPPEMPQALVDQLAPGGRMVVPVGEMYQELKLVKKSADGEATTETLLPVRFVPMVPGEDDE